MRRRSSSSSSSDSSPSRSSSSTVTRIFVPSDLSPNECSRISTQNVKKLEQPISVTSQKPSKTEHKFVKNCPTEPTKLLKNTCTPRGCYNLPVTRTTDAAALFLDCEKFSREIALIKDLCHQLVRKYRL